jgi:hypothetical protein
MLLEYGWLGLFAAPTPIASLPGGTFEMPKEWVLRGAWLSFAAVAGGLYLQYYGCWLLGLIWRTHQAEFGWVAQRFIKEPQQFSGAPLPPPGEQTHEAS